MERMLRYSGIIKTQLKTKKVGLIGAVYNLTSGVVEFDVDNAQI